MTRHDDEKCLMLSFVYVRGSRYDSMDVSSSTNTWLGIDVTTLLEIQPPLLSLFRSEM